MTWRHAQHCETPATVEMGVEEWTWGPWACETECLLQSWHCFHTSACQLRLQPRELSPLGPKQAHNLHHTPSCHKGVCLILAGLKPMLCSRTIPSHRNKSFPVEQLTVLAVSAVSATVDSDGAATSHRLLPRSSLLKHALCRSSV